MKKTTYTHLAKIYGIPCYFNENTMDVKGVNIIYDLIIRMRVWVEETFPFGDHFEIELISEL